MDTLSIKGNLRPSLSSSLMQKTSLVACLEGHRYHTALEQEGKGKYCRAGKLQNTIKSTVHENWKSLHRGLPTVTFHHHQILIKQSFILLKREHRSLLMITPKFMSTKGSSTWADKRTGKCGLQCLSRWYCTWQKWYNKLKRFEMFCSPQWSIVFNTEK